MAAALVVATAVAVAFGPAWQAEFVRYDDDLNFLSNERFRGVSGEPLRWMFTTGWMGHYQPLSWWTLGADYVIAGGLDGPTFHRTNLFFHGVGALLFGLLARRLLAAGSRIGGVGAGVAGDTAIGIGALAAALAFAIHPMRVESVAWVTERRDVVSGAFFLGTLLAWASGPMRGPCRRFGRGRVLAASALAAATVGLALAALDLSRVETLGVRPGAAILLPGAALCLAGTSALTGRGVRAHGALVLLMLSLGAKAWGIVMPALLLVLDFWPRRRGRLVDVVTEKLPFAALAAIFAVLAAWAQSGLYATLKTLEQHGVVERLAQVFYGLAFYPSKTLLPVSLGPFYELPENIDLGAPRFLLPALVVTLATVALVAARRRFPAGLTAWAAFAVMISPVLGVFQSGPQLVAERYSYLSCLPFALLGGAAVTAGIRAGGWRSHATLAGALAVGIVLGVLTWRQSTHWTDSRALFAHTAKVRPQHSVAWLHRATLKQEEALAERDSGRRAVLLGEAREFLEEGVGHTNDPRLLGALAAVHASLAEVEPGTASEHRLRAVEYATEALQVAAEKGQSAPLYGLALGTHLLAAGRPREALHYLVPYVDRFPSRPEGQFQLARALLATGDARGAARRLRTVTEQSPNRVEAWRLLGQALEETGETNGAARAYQRVLALAPEDAHARERMRALLR